MSEVTIQLPGTIFWSKPFDFENGDAVSVTRTEKYTWSREMTKVHFREEANQAVETAKSQSTFGGEAGGSWDIFSAKRLKDETREVVKESGIEKTVYTVGPKGRIIAYQMHFVGPGISVASKQVITRPEPDPEFEEKLAVQIDCELRAHKFLQGIKIVYGRLEQNQPDDIIPVINNDSPNINYGFEDADFVWLVPEWGKKASDSETCTDLRCRQSEESTPNGLDLASGAGGTYRYLQIGRNPNVRDKIVDIRMIRSKIEITGKSLTDLGYDGISNDFNADRGHDYLYLIWKTITLDNTVLS